MSLSESQLGAQNGTVLKERKNQYSLADGGLGKTVSRLVQVTVAAMSNQAVGFE